MQPSNNDIWLLTDDRKGNSSQIFGVAKYIKSKKIFEKKIYYNNFAILPNIFLIKNIPHIKKRYKKQFKPPWPKLVIGCGRRSAPLGLWIKKQSKNYSKFVQIMWPGYPYKNIDLIFTPKHDKIINKKNVINIFTSPNIIDNNLLEKSNLKWKNKLQNLSSPKIAVLIGGNTKKHKLKPNHITNLMSSIKSIIGNKKGSLLITTSRRTSLECLKKIEQEIKNFPIKSILWGPYKKSENPYFGFLSYSDLIIVTGDSISLCSEASATGKPVLIFAPDDITITKHRNFHNLLIKNNIAMDINKFNINKIKNFNYKPINEASNIAKIITEKFL